MVLGLRDAASLRWTLIMMTTVDGCGWDLSLTKTNTGREGEGALHHLDVESCQKSFVYDATDAKGTKEQSHFGPPSAYSAALTVCATIHVRARKLNRPTGRPMAGQIDRPPLSTFSSPLFCLSSDCFLR